MYLVNNGGDPNKDFGVDVVERDGNYYVKIGDPAKVRKGIGELLGKLQVIKSTGDAEAAAKLFDEFGTKVNQAWKENIKARKAKLKLPKLKAFVFPRLVPVITDGKITDVNIVYDEDLTAQHLRFSRLQYVTDLAAK